MNLNLLIQLPILLFSVILHEIAHGWMAERHGDDTARMMGRLTFNPLPHIDFMWTIVIPAVCLLSGAPVFGAAKPVPVNPYRLRNPRTDMIWVSLAGPMSNIGLAITASLLMWLIRILPFASVFTVSFYELCRLVLYVNILLPVFNLFPIPPLDGSRVVMGLLPSKLAYEYSKLESYGFIIIIIFMYVGLFDRILWPIVNIIVSLMGGGRIF